MARATAAALGLAVGLAAVAWSWPASAFHVELRAIGASATSVTLPATAPPLGIIGDDLVLVGVVEGAGPGALFAHTFNFGFDLPAGLAQGIASASLNPVFNRVEGTITAGFSAFEATLSGPGLGVLDLVRDEPPLDPRENRIATENFAAIDTGGDTPYILTVSGRLANSAAVGNYTGNIGVVPLPGAILLFLTAVGALAIIRYRRSTPEPAAA